MRMILLDKTQHAGNPFRKISYIPPISEIISVSFKKTTSIRRKSPKRRQTREEKIAEAEKERMATLALEMTNRLDRIVNQFPWINDIHPFYFEICNLVGNVDKIRKVLGRLGGISQKIKDIEREQLVKLFQTEHPLEMAKIRRETGGRFASLIKKAEGDVKYLIRTVKRLKSFPDFNVLLPTIVIAGAPNVGKSSLVRDISSGIPEIGEYPFTTKQIVFGHREYGFMKIQIVDTPGILDRPIKERSVIERQSIATIRYVSDIIVFMFDVSKDAAIPLDEQLNLIEEISSEFPDTPIIKVLNKIDLITDKKKEVISRDLQIEFQISLKNKTGIKELAEELEEMTKKIIKEDEKFRKAFDIAISEEFLPVDKDEEIDYEI
jgi:nucleolar GTP-binding protein